MGFQLFEDAPTKAPRPDTMAPVTERRTARTPTESGCYLQPDHNALADRSALAGGPNRATALPHEVREALGETGKPLSGDVRAGLESRLGADLSHVRIHDDHKAADAAASTRSLAFTVGHDIVFAADRFAPATRAGRALLSHELAHVIEQRGAAPTDRAYHRHSATGAAPTALARQPDPQPAPDSARRAFLRAVQRGDAIGIQLALNDMSEAERSSLANDATAMRQIDQRLPPAVRLRVHMRLRFGAALPADVSALLRAATDRNASQVAAVLKANVRLRDPGDFPGLIPMVKAIFAGDREALGLIESAAALSKQEMLDFARQSPHLAEQERSTTETVRRAEGRDVSLGATSEAGQTLTNVSAAAIQISAPGGRRDFAIKYSHELSNLRRSVLGRDASGRPGSPRTDQYTSADAYATAVLEWEAWSVVDRAIVAAELDIGTDWISALGRDFKAGKISRGQIFTQVVARLEQFVTTDDSGKEISARENYRRQWERARALTAPGAPH